MGTTSEQLNSAEDPVELCDDASSAEPATSPDEPKTSDDLKRDIEVKRDELSEHVTALGNHVAPAHMAKRRLDQLRGAVLGGANADDRPDAIGGSDTRSLPAVAAATFTAGLIVGLWAKRRRYKAAIRRARARP